MAMNSQIRIPVILEVHACLFLWITQLASMEQVLLPFTTTMTGASLCLSRSETCILLKGCNFKLLNQTIPAGVCIEGTSKLFANFTSVPPTFGFQLNMVRPSLKKQCDCSACKQLCSMNRYNDTASAPKKSTKSSERCKGCKTCSSPPAVSTQPFRLDKFEFEAAANTCLALSKDNNCLLGKFCDIQLNGIQQGDIIPPACIEGSATIISFFDINEAMKAPIYIPQMMFFQLSDDFQTQKLGSGGAETVCDCKVCSATPCTTNPLSPTN